MHRRTAHITLTHRVITVLVFSLLFSMPVISARAAQQKTTQDCSAFVSLANSYYLVNSAGKVLTRFTPSTSQISDVAISPDGQKIAYLATPGGTNMYAFSVTGARGQTGSFSTRPSAGLSPVAHDIANNPIEALSWNSRNVVRVTKFAGKDLVHFEFYRIPGDISPPAPMAAKPVNADNCVLKGNGGQVACIEQDGAIYLGGEVSGQEVFSVSGFEGIKPEESLTLGAGQSASTTGTRPIFKVTLKGIGKDGIDLRIATPDGGWWETFLQNGGFTGSPLYLGPQYGFFVTVIDAKAQRVRIDVVKGQSPYKLFDQALAWQPNGQGLLFIRRTNKQAFLYLIQPGRGHVSGHPAKGQGPQWHLAAKVPVLLPGREYSMRFLTPSLLLLNTNDFGGAQYSELPIHIANGQDDGKPSMTIGTVKPVPDTIPININGNTSSASVLDWSCKMPHGDTEQD